MPFSYKATNKLDKTVVEFNTIEEFDEVGHEGAWDIACLDETVPDLFDIFKVDQASLPAWFDFLDLSETERAAAYCLCVHGSYANKLGYAVDKAGAVQLVERDLFSYAADVFFEIFTVPKELIPYIDTARYATSAELGGELHQFEYEGKTYTVTNWNAV